MKLRFLTDISMFVKKYWYLPLQGA